MKECDKRNNHISSKLHMNLISHLSLKMEQIECSETSAYINQTPGNHPKENNIHMNCISCNDGRHPVTKTFTTLHSTSLHLSSTFHFFTLLRWDIIASFLEIHTKCTLRGENIEFFNLKTGDMWASGV